MMAVVATLKAGEAHPTELLVFKNGVPGNICENAVWLWHTIPAMPTIADLRSLTHKPEKLRIVWQFCVVESTL